MSITYQVEVDEYRDIYWRLNGQMHREDGPAIEYPEGDKFWYLNGKLHREDGPAAEWEDGTEEWYLDGRHLTEQEFNARTQTYTGKVIEVDGKKYRLQEV